MPTSSIVRSLVRLGQHSAELEPPKNTSERAGTSLQICFDAGFVAGALPGERIGSLLDEAMVTVYDVSAAMDAPEVVQSGEKVCGDVVVDGRMKAGETSGNFCATTFGNITGALVAVPSAVIGSIAGGAFGLGEDTADFVAGVVFGEDPDVDAAAS